MKKHTEEFETIEPYISIEGLSRFLASTYIKGVGEVYGKAIAEALGFDIFKPDFDFKRLASVVPSLHGEKAEKFKEDIDLLKFPWSAGVLLYSAGLSDAEVEKVLSHYGRNAIIALIEDPYDMVENAWKVSFFTADKLGKWLGVTHDDPRRLRGALLTAVKFYAERGSLFATEDQAVKTASSLTCVREVLVRKQLDGLIDEERLVRSREGIYLPVYFHAEKQTAKKLAHLVNRAPRSLELIDVPQTDIEGNPLNSDQLEALETVMRHPVTIITGGPGTGKTTAVRGIVRMFEDLDKKVVLVAPTGRAAKRLSDLAGSEAKTIHRLLGYSMGKGYRNKRFDAGILVIDEASMLEQVLFAHLLDALGEDVKIVLVGDTNQLPAIGAGNVLNDLIESGTVPVISMSENFRQKAGSNIAATAQGVKLGVAPSEGNLKDFILVTEKNASDILKSVLHLVAEKIPLDFGIDPKDIQVVSPQQDGILGARELNVKIQEHVNPGGPALKTGKRILRLGDRVMQTANSSDRDIYNGETGWISAVDPEANCLEVTFYDGKKLVYGKERLKEISLAYATTVHKLQGSETDYMVMVLSGIHRNLLYRNLLYTGISRARKLCVLVGETRAIETALSNDNPTIRNSNLASRMREYTQKTSSKN